jgi:hypothetical protein
MTVATLTAEQWRDTLDKELECRRPRIQKLEAYYAGNHPLTFATAKFREAFGSVFREFADNWCQLIIDASVERLSVDGIAFGDEALDDQAHSFWQSNKLDLQALKAHTEAVKCGISYLMVDPFTTKFSAPRITVEHPLQMIVECDPADEDNRLAAYKKWVGLDGYLYSTLYLPTGFYKWVSEKAQDEYQSASDVVWTEREGGFLKNPLGVVPVIPLINNPQLLSKPLSDLDPIMPLQDVVNKLMTDMVVDSEYHAYPQRVITGLEVPLDPITGQPVKTAELKAAMSRLWTFENKDVKVEQLAASDLSSFVTAIELVIRHIAALTKTPPHYLLGQMTNISSDALVAAETGLVNKVRRKQLSFGQAWEDAMRLCFLASGDEATYALPAETLWRDAESKSIAQNADAAVKALNAQVPIEVVWAKYFGATPQEIAQWRNMKRLPEPKVMSDPLNTEPVITDTTDPATAVVDG